MNTGANLLEEWRVTSAEAFAAHRAITDACIDACLRGARGPSVADRRKADQLEERQQELLKLALDAIAKNVQKHRWARTVSSRLGR